MVPPSGASQVNSSIKGRCKSISSFSDKPAFSFNSSIFPIHSTYSGSLSLTQIGMGVPQKRCREIAQSTLFSSQVPKRPLPVLSGFQFILEFNSTIRSFTLVVFINQDSTGYDMSGVPFRQSKG